MTDRVNTTMHRQQPPLGHPVTDHSPTHSSGEQLGARDDPMLALSQLGDPVNRPDESDIRPLYGAQFHSRRAYPEAP